MAVEARHLNFFPTATEPNMNPFTGYLLPPSVTTAESFVPVYNNNSAAMAESDLTYLPASRKRPRDSTDSTITRAIRNIRNSNRCDPFAYLGDDLLLQLQLQQLEMDRLISQQNDRLRMVIEESMKKDSLRIISAVEPALMKILKAKDDEIDEIGKLNCALQDKVKSLCVEGQIWRDLACTNEATARVLRANLEQVLASQLDSNYEHANVVAFADDGQSCCGSNDREEDGEEFGGNRRCRHCGEGESSVLLLPCRHLCLCTVCGSSVHTCPVCNSPKNASVQVIMPS